MAMKDQLLWIDIAVLSLKVYILCLTKNNNCFLSGNRMYYNVFRIYLVYIGSSIFRANNLSVTVWMIL